MSLCRSKLCTSLCCYPHTELWIFAVLSKQRWNVNPATTSLMGPALIGRWNTWYVGWVTALLFVFNIEIWWLWNSFLHNSRAKNEHWVFLQLPSCVDSAVAWCPLSCVNTVIKRQQWKINIWECELPACGHTPLQCLSAWKLHGRNTNCFHFNLPMFGFF